MDIINVNGIVNDEIGNWIDKGIVYYNNAKYQFDDYYYNGDGFVMLRFEDVEEDTEVGVISHYLVRIVELEKNVYFVEDVNYEYCCCDKCSKYAEEYLVKSKLEELE